MNGNPPESADQDNAAGRHRAGARLLESMRKGINFGGERFDRSELYDERITQLDERRDVGAGPVSR